jgi:hypothetical protein
MPGSFLSFVRASGLCFACLRLAFAICFWTFALCFADDLEEFLSKPQVRAEVLLECTVHAHFDGLEAVGEGKYLNS